MSIKGLIFDLDQTIIDSSIAEPYRNSRAWSKVYSLIPQFQPYVPVIEVMKELSKNGFLISIVTSSPSKYAKQVMSHFDVPYHDLVDYFATTRRKPYPDPMFKALENLGLAACEVLSFGDRAVDVFSSNSAKIGSVACLWGTSEREILLKSNPTWVINSPHEIVGLLNN